MSIHETPPSPDFYEGQGLKGPARDFEEVFQAGTQMSSKLHELPGARELFDEVVNIIDQTQFPVEGANIEEVIRAVRAAAKEQNWENYDDVKFDEIRKNLEKAGIPLLRKKTGGDYAG